MELILISLIPGLVMMLLIIQMITLPTANPTLSNLAKVFWPQKQLWDVKGTTLSSQFHMILMKMVLLVRMILSGYTVILTNREHPAQLLILLFLLMEQLGIMNMFVIIGTAFPMRMAEKPLRETMKIIQSTAQITTTSL